MVSRNGGGHRAAGGDRSRETGREKKGANARACTREAREGVRGPEEAVPVLKQVLAPRRRAWQPRRSSSRKRAAWPSEEGPVRRREAVGQRPGWHVARF
jgi:hypothetical protein